MAQLPQRILQPGASVRPRILDPVDVDELVFPCCRSRIDEDQAVVVLDDRQRNAKGMRFLSSGRRGAPECFGTIPKCAPV